MNSRSRFFLERDEWGQASPALTGDEAKHCAMVLRKSVGDTIEVFDGQGRAALAELISVSKGRCELRLGEVRDRADARGPRLVLAVAIPKGKTMDLIVQKAVELGVSAIQPLLTEHTVVRLDAREAVKKTEKWQRIALEACKQCGQNELPQIATPIAMSSWLEQGFEKDAFRFIASLAPGAASLKERLAGDRVRGQDASLLVGPEGDFSDEEIDLALAAGFEPVTLGEIVLRVETAVFYAASIIRYEQGL